jgi:hypothetical protein
MDKINMYPQFWHFELRNHNFSSLSTTTDVSFLGPNVSGVQVENHLVRYKNAGAQKQTYILTNISYNGSVCSSLGSDNFEPLGKWSEYWL